MKNIAVLTEDGAFALFFCPHPGGFESSIVPTSRSLSSKAKKMLMPGGGGDQLRGKSKADTVPAAETTFNSLRFGESGSVRTRSDRNNRILDIFQVFTVFLVAL